MIHYKIGCKDMKNISHVQIFRFTFQIKHQFTFVYTWQLFTFLLNLTTCMIYRHLVLPIVNSSNIYKYTEYQLFIYYTLCHLASLGKTTAILTMLYGLLVYVLLVIT